MATKDTKKYTFTEVQIAHYLAWQEEAAAYAAAGITPKLPEWYPRDNEELAAMGAAAEKYKAEKESQSNG